VLAVGDAEFQARCLQRIRDLERQGVTILFISHDLTTVEQLCDRALLLDLGEVVAEGVPSDVVAAYHRRIVAAQKSRWADADPIYAQDLLKLTNLTFHAAHGSVHAFRTAEPLVVRLRFEAAQPVEQVSFELTVHSPDGVTLLATLASGASTVLPPAGSVEFVVPSLPLLPGAYHVGARVRDVRTRQVVDWWDGNSTLRVEASADGTDAAGQLHIPYTARVLCDARPQASAARGR
jgi:hypothetical protein